MKRLTCFLFSIALAGAVAAQPSFTGWNAVYPNIVSPAPASQWTPINFTDSFVYSVNGVLTAQITPSGSDNIRMLAKTLPSPPWQFTVGLQEDFQSGNFQFAGIFLRESGSGKIAAHQVGNDQFIGQLYYNSPTSFNSALSGGGYSIQSIRGPIFLRIFNDGTSLQFSFSRDGSSFRPIVTRPVGEFATWDQYGLLMNQTNNKPYGASFFDANMDTFAVGPGQAQPGGLQKYLASWFYGQTQQAFALATSQDGLAWREVATSYANLAAPRDPSIVKISGTWYVAHSIGTGAGTKFRIIKSTNLGAWQLHTDVDWNGQIGSLALVGAPEWFIDPSDSSVHIYAQGCTSTGFTGCQIYETHPTNGPMTTWSTAALVTITGKTNVIDPFMVRKGGSLFLWYKEQTTHFVEWASCSDLVTCSPTRTGDWASWGTFKEGPALVQLSSSKWRVYVDADSAGPNGELQEMYSECNNADWTVCTWTALQQIGGSGATHHGTVLKL